MSVILILTSLFQQKKKKKKKKKIEQEQEREREQEQEKFVEHHYSRDDEEPVLIF